MAVDLRELGRDLGDEGDLVVGLLKPLTEEQWRLPTPAKGWTIKDQVSHLAFFDEAAATAVTDPDLFRNQAERLTAHGDDFTEEIAREHRSWTGADLLAWFTGARERLLDVFTGVDPAARLPWFGPPMSPASSLTARLMETWAHGLDIAETLGRPPSSSPRLRHIAHLGYATIGWSFTVHGRLPPESQIRLELISPDGGTWTWGPADAADRIAGSALEFCLLITQRRHLDDLHLTVAGETATQYARLAQAFAGPSGPGREPRKAQ